MQLTFLLFHKMRIRRIGRSRGRFIILHTALFGQRRLIITEYRERVQFPRKSPRGHIEIVRRMMFQTFQHLSSPNNLDRRVNNVPLEGC